MPKTVACLVYPHQLWDHHPAVEAAQRIFLVEDPLFFTQYHFHKQKLVLHRASMSEFAERCRSQGKNVQRIEARALVHSGDIAKILAREGIERAIAVDPCDDWLQRRVSQGCKQAGIVIAWLEDPAFLTPAKVLSEWAADRDHLHFTDFYMLQRKRLRLLLDAKSKPLGGKWTFDTDNRKRLPKGIAIPALPTPPSLPSVIEAKRYVDRNFPSALGSHEAFTYPVRHSDALIWLDRFVEERLANFGDYEDAISSHQTFAFHSVLTPALNIGLITPQQVIDDVIAKADDIPINSLEGFVRQVIGWREFIRLVYLRAGSRQRRTNAWNLKCKLPPAFYSGTTGIAPVDRSIERTLRYAYCHHIERLMVLGNFMLLCDIDPDEVYRWFMELFIDAYDWVMVPNVYGMSQHADGGLMTTKPYISGSSYILKMSDFAKGDWCPIWDSLYWRFVDRERTFFSGNPRMRVMVGQLDKMGPKLDEHRRRAETFLERLHSGKVGS